jgi:hypothetical protein
VREAEAARGLIQLRRGDPEVEQDSVEPAASQPRLGNRAELFEAGMPNRETCVRRKSIAAVSHRVGIFIQGE